MKKTVLSTMIIIIILIALAGLFAPRSNPPVERTIAWDSTATRKQFMISCGDCHSNETSWPWYSYVGPMAFFVTHNVNEGREHFNISQSKMGEADECIEEIQEGEMPPWDYLIFHTEANLNDTSKDEFLNGLRLTFESELDDDH